MKYIQGENRMRYVRWGNAASIILLLSVFACAGVVSGPPSASDAPLATDLSAADAQAKKIYDTFYPALATATDWYILANDAVKAAHESDVITSDQVRALRLREAKTALETARSTAISYLRALQAGETIGNTDTSRFTSQILAAQSIVNSLIQLAKELEVIP